MLKSLLIVLGFMLLGIPAQACNMKKDITRPQIVEYVRDGLICLDNPPDGFRFDELIEQAFVDKINAERMKRDLPALDVRPELLPAARFHSLDMGVNEFFNHVGLDERRAAQRIAAFDRTMLAQGTGENIAKFGPMRCYDGDDNEVSCFNLPGYKLPSPAFVADDLHVKLMNSDGHRANILSEDYTHIAVGVARTDTGFYVTQVFAKRVGRLQTPLPTVFAENASMSLAPKISGWGVGRFIVADLDGTETDLRSDRLRRVLPGEKKLIVVGQNKSKESRGGKVYERTEWMKLSGPSFTLSSAKES
ncbi:MAG: CAP domain-containing protein [Pseudomonadota bacterium]